MNSQPETLTAEAPTTHHLDAGDGVEARGTRAERSEEGPKARRPPSRW